MKKLSFLFLLIITLSSCWQEEKYEDTTHAFIVFENNRYGYINQKGEEFISPRFRDAQPFSELLAPVRFSGRYGYTNSENTWIIAPKYDYATPFSDGLALVYQEGKPYYINKKGKKAFETPYEKLYPFQHKRAKVITQTGKQGFIDVNGELFIDTVYSSIHDFNDGLASVEGVNHNPYKDENKPQKFEVGVIDTLGNFVIPYGKYIDIGGNINGYFQAKYITHPDDDEAVSVILNSTGEQMFSNRFSDKEYYIAGMPSSGLVPMSLCQYWNPKKKRYEGYANLKGELIINDTNIYSAEPFYGNRAVVYDDEYDPFIINKKGERVESEPFDAIEEDGYKNGWLVVRSGWNWGIMDTNGRFVVQPKYDNVRLLNDTFFAFGIKDTNSEKSYAKLYGIQEIGKSEPLIPPIMQDYSRAGFVNGLLECIVERKQTFINEQNEIVWQEKPHPYNLPLELVDIDHMNRGYFYAGSQANQHDIGGFAQSENHPKPKQLTDEFMDGELILKVDTNYTDTLHGKFLAHSVKLLNGKGNVDFSAQDGRLYMKVQAIDRSGTWKDIEYLPSSWCGNSYHTLTLRQGEKWNFTTPAYQGEFRTKLRIELEYIDPDQPQNIKRWDRESIKLYSNEYKGSVNPGQFWRKPGYSPNGIMDPYFD